MKLKVKNKEFSKDSNKLIGMEKEYESVTFSMGKRKLIF